RVPEDVGLALTVTKPNTTLAAWLCQVLFGLGNGCDLIRRRKLVVVALVHDHGQQALTLLKNVADGWKQRFNFVFNFLWVHGLVSFLPRPPSLLRLLRQLGRRLVSVGRSYNRSAPRPRSLS